MNHGQNTGGGENPNRATGNFKLNIDERDLATGNIDLPERRSQPPRRPSGPAPQATQTVRQYL